MRRIRNVLVGTRFSPARGDRCTAHKSLAFGFLCPPKKRTDQKPNQAPRMPVHVLVSPVGLPCFDGHVGVDRMEQGDPTWPNELMMKSSSEMRWSCC